MVKMSITYTFIEIVPIKQVIYMKLYQYNKSHMHMHKFFIKLFKYTSVNLVHCQKSVRLFSTFT